MNTMQKSTAIVAAVVVVVVVVVVDYKHEEKWETVQ
jgi:hypothetical protein